MSFKVMPHVFLMKIIHAKKGISPIIATIILIILTVVAGGFIYTYTMGMLQNSALSNVANIQNYFLVPGAGNTATLTMTIQNAGTRAITSISIISLNNLNTSKITTPFKFIGSIAPGSTMGNSTTIIGNTPFIAGVTYTATILITFSNNGTQVIATELVASSI